MLYSKSTGGFYDPNIHGSAIPADAKPVPRHRYTELMVAQAAGKEISTNENGEPCAVDPQQTPRESAIDAIRGLEALVTPRRLREAVLGVDGGWLADIDARIAQLRTELGSDRPSL